MRYRLRGLYVFVGSESFGIFSYLDIQAQALVCRPKIEETENCAGHIDLLASNMQAEVQQGKSPFM